MRSGSGSDTIFKLPTSLIIQKLIFQPHQRSSLVMRSSESCFLLKRQRSTRSTKDGNEELIKKFLGSQLIHFPEFGVNLIQRMWMKLKRPIPPLQIKCAHKGLCRMSKMLRISSYFILREK